MLNIQTRICPFSGQNIQYIVRERDGLFVTVYDRQTVLTCAQLAKQVEQYMNPLAKEALQAAFDYGNGLISPLEAQDVYGKTAGYALEPGRMRDFNALDAGGAAHAALKGDPMQIRHAISRINGTYVP